MSGPGSELGQLGPYRLRKRIGRGGMAEVLLAEDAAGHHVVVKRVLPHLATEQTYVKLFLREARIAARLRHDNVVQLLDADRDGDDLYLVFEHVDGVTLHELARRAWHNDRALPVELCVQAIADAAIGLHHAHELKDERGQPSGLVHRDVSPDNLMIDSAGVTRVLDFGIAKTAKSATNVTRTGELRGKLAFMSPEQAQGEPVDRRSDLFSLGVTLFWLLTAQKPFSGRTDLLTLKALLEQDAPAPSSLNPNVPRALDPIVLQLLAKDARRRPSSARELHQSLTRLLAPAGDLRGVAGRFVVDVLALREAKDSTVIVAMPTVPSDCVVLLSDAAAQDARDRAPDANAARAKDTLPLPVMRKRTRAPLLVVAGALTAAGVALVAALALTPRPGASPRAGARVMSAPVEAAPVEAAPIEAAPVEAAPVEAAPVEAADVAPAPVAPLAALVEERSVKVAPAGLAWRAGRRSLTVKSGEVRVPVGAARLSASDAKRGATYDVPIVDGRADVGALADAALRVWLPPAGGEVFLGDTKIGDAPLRPLVVKVGRYRVRAKSGGATEERVVEARAGENPPVRFFTK